MNYKGVEIPENHFIEEHWYIGTIDCWYGSGSIDADEFNDFFEAINKQKQEHPNGEVEFIYNEDNDDNGVIKMFYKYHIQETPEEKEIRIAEAKAKIDRIKEVEYRKMEEKRLNDKKLLEDRIKDATKFLEDQGYKVKLKK